MDTTLLESVLRVTPSGVALGATAGAAMTQACGFAVRASGSVGSSRNVQLIGEHSGPAPLTIPQMELQDRPAPLTRPTADALACSSVSDFDQRLSTPRASVCVTTSARR